RQADVSALREARRRLQADRRHVHRACPFFRGPAQPAYSAQHGAMASAREYVPSSAGPRARDVEPDREIRTEWHYFNSGRFQSSRLNINATRLRMDGAPLSMGENAGRNLVGRAPDQRQTKD